KAGTSLAALSRVEPHGRIEAELGARLGDRDRAVVLGDVVDAGGAAFEREQRGMRGRVDVDRWRARRGLVPGAGSVEKAVAQHDAADRRRSEHRLLERRNARDGERAHALGGEIERVALVTRSGTRRIGKRNTLRDYAARAGRTRRVHEVARPVAAQAIVAFLPLFVA